MLVSRVSGGVLTLACLTTLACSNPPRGAPQPVQRDPLGVLEPVPSPAPAMECSFDPVSQSSDTETKSGFEMCYTPALRGVPWTPPASGPPLDLRAAASASATPEPGDDADPWLRPVDSPAEAPPAPCPADMVLVEGKYCPEVRHSCKSYIDEGFLSKHRCREFNTTPECLAPREHRRFCIDRDEYHDDEGLPLIDMSWRMSVDLCESLGKRLCFESEWQFACEGEELRPYPYGFVRNSKICNHDKKDLTDERSGELLDLRRPVESLPECVSPFGVRNMVGNADEWAWRDGMQKPWRSALRGGWWLAGRNNCRAATTGHDEFYFGKQTGFRCCLNAL